MSFNLRILGNEASWIQGNPISQTLSSGVRAKRPYAHRHTWLPFSNMRFLRQAGTLPMMFGSRAQDKMERRPTSSPGE